MPGCAPVSMGAGHEDLRPGAPGVPEGELQGTGTRPAAAALPGEGATGAGPVNPPEKS